MKKFASLCMSLGVALAACGDAQTPPAETPPIQNPPVTDPPVQNPPAGATLSGMVAADQTISGAVSLTGDVTVAKTAKLTVAAGTVLSATGNYSLTVAGTLVVQGTAASGVQFTTAAGTTGWGGVAVSGAGQATISYTQISGAQQAFAAAAGSSYAIDHLTIQQSYNGLSLAANGTVSKTVFTGVGQSQYGSPVRIQDSSPTFTDLKIEKGSSGTDSIIVNGSSSPQFDHVEVSNYHCAFHFNSGSNITINDSYVHDNYYAVMVDSASPFTFKNSNFMNNQTTNIGDCSGATVMASGNYYGGGAAAFDSSCAGQTNTSPVSSMISGAGYRP